VNYWMLFLRLLHIGAGVFWAGSALMMTFFLSPTMVATQEVGQRFAGHLIQRTRFSLAISVAGSLTVLAGVIMYWLDSNGLNLRWITSGPGLAFTIGGLAGMGALVTGINQGRIAGSLTSLGGQIGAQGKPPSANQAEQLQKLQAKIHSNGNLNAIFIITAVILMALARYLNF
jgi:uncharacterized membrane protein